MLQFKLPAIGEGVVEGEIVQWLKKPGDPVRANEALVEVMTDKATVEIPAPKDCVVAELRADEGAVAAVGEIIAVLDDTGAAKVLAAPIAAAPQPESSAPPPSAPGPSSMRAKPSNGRTSARRPARCPCWRPPPLGPSPASSGIDLAEPSRRRARTHHQGPTSCEARADVRYHVAPDRGGYRRLRA